MCGLLFGLTVFAHLKVVGQIHSIADDIVRPRCEVHVANRTPGNHQPSKHLGQIVRGNAVTIAGINDSALPRSVSKSEALWSQG